MYKSAENLLKKVTDDLKKVNQDFIVANRNSVHAGEPSVLLRELEKAQKNLDNHNKAVSAAQAKLDSLTKELEAAKAARANLESDKTTLSSDRDSELRRLDYETKLAEDEVTKTKNDLASQPLFKELEEAQKEATKAGTIDFHQAKVKDLRAQLEEASKGLPSTHDKVFALTSELSKAEYALTQASYADRALKLARDNYDEAIKLRPDSELSKAHKAHNNALAVHSEKVIAATNAKNQFNSKAEDIENQLQNTKNTIARDELEISKVTGDLALLRNPDKLKALKDQIEAAKALYNDSVAKDSQLTAMDMLKTALENKVATLKARVDALEKQMRDTNKASLEAGDANALRDKLVKATKDAIEAGDATDLLAALKKAEAAASAGPHVDGPSQAQLEEAVAKAQDAYNAAVQADELAEKALQSWQNAVDHEALAEVAYDTFKQADSELKPLKQHADLLEAAFKAANKASLEAGDANVKFDIAQAADAALTEASNKLASATSTHKATQLVVDTASKAKEEASEKLTLALGSLLSSKENEHAKQAILEAAEKLDVCMTEKPADKTSKPVPVSSPKKAELAKTGAAAENAGLLSFAAILGGMGIVGAARYTPRHRRDAR